MIFFEIITILNLDKRKTIFGYFDPRPKGPTGKVGVDSV
jgi:hypothetical protein